MGSSKGWEWLEADHIDNAVAARMRRRNRLHDAESPLRFSAVIDESVLRRPVGGPVVMRRQLAALLEFMNLPNVSLRILSGVQGAHRGLEGSFTLLSYADADETDLLFLEHTAGSLHIDKLEAVSTAASAFEGMRASALNGEDSAAFISRLMSGCEPE